MSLALCTCRRAGQREPRVRTGLSQQAGARDRPVHRRAARPTSSARTFGQKLSEMWGQPVIVENRAGAGGTIGAGIVAKSPPDGYTLIVHSAAQAYNASIYPTLPYDTSKDFVDIAPLAGQPNVLVVAPSLRHQVGRRTDRAGEAEAGAAQLRLGGHRQRHAHQRREIQARGRHRRHAHSLQGHARGAQRHARRARHLFLLADFRGDVEHPEGKLRCAGA